MRCWAMRSETSRRKARRRGCEKFPRCIIWIGRNSGYPPAHFLQAKADIEVLRLPSSLGFARDKSGGVRMTPFVLGAGVTLVAVLCVWVWSPWHEAVHR